MKFFLLAVGTWLSGLVTFLGGSVVLNGGVHRFAGLVALLSLGVAAPTIVALELLMSSPGLVGLCAGLTSGTVFGAGFFVGFARQSV